MTYLILGGAGFLGANLVRQCLKESRARVIVLDSLDPLFQSTTAPLEAIWDQIRFIRGDVRDDKLIAELVQESDIIFNCAAQSSHTLSIQLPHVSAETDVLGNLKLLEAVRLYHPKAVVIYPSSSTVIGKALEPIVDENHPENPRDLYSANKGIAEKYYRLYAHLHGLRTVVLRFANLYGPWGKPHPEFGFMNYFLGLARQDREIQIFGSGDQTRNVMFAEEAAKIMLLASETPALWGGLFFATSPFHYSVREIAESMLQVFGKGHLQFVEWPQSWGQIEVGPVRFSSEKLRAACGWQARIDLVEGLKRTQDILETFPMAVPR